MTANNFTFYAGTVDNSHFSKREWQIQFTIGQTDNAKVMSPDEFHLTARKLPLKHLQGGGDI
jgi:hypothetical protein